MRSVLPCSPAQFKPDLTDKIRFADQACERLRAKAKARYDGRAKKLEELGPGDVVLVQNPATKLWDMMGEVMKKYPERSSYMIKTESGRLKWRNRRFLRPYHPPLEDEGGHEPVGDSPEPDKDLQDPGSATVPRRGTRKRRAPRRFRDE
jgi:hypothetical protein